jgi:5-methylcytosine-specific restriction protein A
MFKLIFQFFKSSTEEISVLSKPRSKEWSKVRSEHLKKNPFCAVCGNKKNVVPHHIVPFHIDPSKELDPSNLISLCEGDSFNCHLFFGHFRNWAKHNPNISEDAKIWHDKITS